MPDSIYREFPELPDEFEGQGAYTEEAPERRKRNMGWLLGAAAAMLILPVTVLPQFAPGGQDAPHDPSGIPEPVPAPGPDITDDDPAYSITGLWQYGSETYFFSEDGYGFYHDGTYYIRLNWKPQEGTVDSEYTGFGITEISLETVAATFIERTTDLADGGLLLFSYAESSPELFTPAASVYAPEDLLESLGETMEERLQGYWTRQALLDPEQEVCTQYLNLGSEGYGTLRAANLSDTIGEYFTIIYKTDEYGSPLIEITREDGGIMKLEFTNSTGGTDSYTTELVNAYYFIDREGEGILTGVFSGGTVLRRSEGSP